MGEEWESLRSMESPHRERGNGSFNVQDCRVWAEIAYLDSPTDYREVLQAGPVPADRSELVLLDTPNGSLGKDVSRLLLFLSGIMIVGYVVYLVLHTL